MAVQAVDSQASSLSPLLLLPTELLDGTFRRIAGSKKRSVEGVCVRFAAIGKNVHRFAHCSIEVVYSPTPTSPKFKCVGQLHVNGHLVASPQAVRPLVDSLVGRKCLRHLTFRFHHRPVTPLARLQCSAVCEALTGARAPRVQLETLWLEPQFNAIIMFGCQNGLLRLIAQQASSLRELTVGVPVHDALTDFGDITSLINQLRMCQQLRSFTAGYVSDDWQDQLPTLLPALPITSLCLTVCCVATVPRLRDILQMPPTLTELRLHNVHTYEGPLDSALWPVLVNIRTFSVRFDRHCDPNFPAISLHRRSRVLRLLQQAMPRLELLLYQPAGVFNHRLLWRGLRSLAAACFARADPSLTVQLYENTWGWAGDTRREWRSLVRAQAELSQYTVVVDGDTLTITSPTHQATLTVVFILKV